MRSPPTSTSATATSSLPLASTPPRPVARRTSRSATTRPERPHGSTNSFGPGITIPDPHAILWLTWPTICDFAPADQDQVRTLVLAGSRGGSLGLDGPFGRDTWFELRLEGSARHGRNHP